MCNDPWELLVQKLISTGDACLCLISVAVTTELEREKGVSLLNFVLRNFLVRNSRHFASTRPPSWRGLGTSTLEIWESPFHQTEAILRQDHLKAGLRDSLFLWMSRNVWQHETSTNSESDEDSTRSPLIVMGAQNPENYATVKLGIFNVGAMYHRADMQPINTQDFWL